LARVSFRRRHGELTTSLSVDQESGCKSKAHAGAGQAGPIAARRPNRNVPYAASRKSGPRPRCSPACRRLARARLAAPVAVGRERTLPIETKRAPYGASEPCFGASDFFSSPNHWRILAIKLPIGRSYAHFDGCTARSGVATCRPSARARFGGAGRSRVGQQPNRQRHISAVRDQDLKAHWAWLPIAVPSTTNDRPLRAPCHSAGRCGSVSIAVMGSGLPP
jgi:hypothetical protein